MKKDINLIDYSNEDLSSELGLATLERYEINNAKLETVNSRI